MRSESGSMECLVFSFRAILGEVEVFRAVAGSFGGGGRGDLILLPPLGGGASAGVFFTAPVVPAANPTAESMPVPLDGLFFTLIRIVSPSYTPNYQKLFPLNSKGCYQDNPMMTTTTTIITFKGKYWHKSLTLRWTYCYIKYWDRASNVKSDREDQGTGEMKSITRTSIQWNKL